MVAGEDCYVGELADFQTALLILLEGRPGGVDRVGTERFLSSHSLIRPEHFAVLESPADRGMEGRDRIDILDRSIRAVRHDGPRVDEFPPDVGALRRSSFSEPIRYPGSIRCAMDRLHRGDHAQAGKARNVVRVQVLGVFDAPAAVPIAGKSLLEEVERFAVRPVADRVNAQLEVVLQRQPGRLLHHLETCRVQAAGLRHVLIGLQQPGAVGSQGAVDRTFDRANGEKAVSAVDHPVAAQGLRQGFVSLAHHHPQTQRKGPVVRHLSIGVDQFEARTGILKARDALGERLFGRDADDAPNVVPLQGLATQPRDEVLRRFPERPGRLPIRVAHDLAPLRVGSRRVDAGERHRGGHWRRPCDRSRASGVRDVEATPRSGRHEPGVPARPERGGADHFD